MSYLFEYPNKCMKYLFMHIGVEISLFYGFLCL